MFVAIDRTSKFAFAQLHEKANRHTATAFLKALIAVVPYKIHTILTDNGIQFCDLPKNRSGPTARCRQIAPLPPVVLGGVPDRENRVPQCDELSDALQPPHVAGEKIQALRKGRRFAVQFDRERWHD